MDKYIWYLFILPTMKIDGKTAFMSALFVASIFVVGTKLLSPASVKIFVEGNDVAVTRIPGFFTFTDCILVALSACILGVSATYLLFIDSVPTRPPQPDTTKKKEGWGHTMETLKDDELKIYEIIFAVDGIIFQSELIDKTGFSKAKVSRCLSLLESRGLVERRRRGMSNIVLLR